MMLWHPTIFFFFLAAGALASAGSFAPRQAASNYNNINTPAPNFSFEQLFQLQKKFLDNFISPANAAQVDASPPLGQRPSLTD